MEGEGGSRGEITYLVRNFELLTLSDELGLGNGSLKALEGLCVEVLQVLLSKKVSMAIFVKLHDFIQC